MPVAPELTSSLYKTLVNSARDIITMIDVHGVVLYQNPAIRKILGYTPEEFTGTRILDYIHEDDAVEVAKGLEAVMDPEMRVTAMTIRFRHRNGEWRFLNVAGRYIEGEFPGIVLSVRDVTAQEEALKSLRYSTESFRAAFNATSAISAITVPETGEFVDVNTAWVNVLGWSREEAIGRTAVELGIWGSEENRNRVFAALGDNRQLRGYKAYLYARSGRRITALIDIGFFELEEGRFSFVSGIDITEREQIEEQLRQAQKLESIGQLTGGIAHDFNNLLSVIMGHAELAEMEVENSPGAMTSLSAIRRSAQSGATLIHQLLAFSRKQSLSPEPIVLSQRIRSILPLLRTTVGKDIRIIVEGDDDEWLCLLDPNQFESAILNMAINARDAMPDGGTLTLSLTRVCMVPAQARVLDMPVGDYVQLDIMDNGVGMPPDAVARAFEPFFTTKHTSGGTGLGLSMVFGFIKQSGGHISITSDRRGGGTTITLLLPRTDDPSRTEPPQEERTVQKLHHQRVLLIEDNSDVRALISKMLASLNLEVTEARSGDDAKRHLDTTFDLLVSDVMLPGELKGPDFARQLKKTHPDMAVLYMSGYQQGMLSREDLNQRNVSFIQKPFTRKEFSVCIEKLLK